MDTVNFDAIVIGAGIAGATVAAALAPTHRTALIEAEEAAGYHATGRSAASWILNYGPPDVRALTGASRAFLETPPPGFSEAPILRRRMNIYLAPPDQVGELAAMLADGVGLREISIGDAKTLVPALRDGYAVRALVEEDVFDIDVAALHQGFLRQARRNGGTLALRSRSMRIARQGGLWHVEVTGGAHFTAAILVNAAGAWGDEVASQAGFAPLGLVPKRRTGVIIDPAPWQVADWPFVMAADGSWYCRPEARTRLMVSPADATPMPPQDIQPDEFDIAVAIDHMTAALDIEVKRVERSWAGLRTFTPDGSLALGRAGDGYFCCLGQGGYGIQTSPAVGALVAALVTGTDPGYAPDVLAMVDPNRFAGRRAPDQ
jgi:D-arginine dehydrogenase